MPLFTPFLSKKRKNHYIITVVQEKTLKTWLKSQTSAVKEQAEEQGFKGKSGNVFIMRDKNGKTSDIIVGADRTILYTDSGKIYDGIKATFAANLHKSLSFEFDQGHLSDDEFNVLNIGWGLAAYQFDSYKKDKNTPLGLCLPKTSNKKRIHAIVESVCLIRDLVNTPANDMGPDELEAATAELAAHHDTTLKTIKDEALIKKNFPMIYDVGKASTRRPRLLDFTWGNAKHPKVTLVGKGVCFDTGGLDIKPPQYMLNMKKDMGGSAHVLGLAHMIMSLKLPICLRVLIPAVENSISGNAYRPADVLKTRKGITVEVGNTDAEGRLVLADALTYACEDTPELLIDFATLTGAARVALGHDLPALFSNSDKMAHSIQVKSAKPKIDDPVWHLPLWQGYRKDMESSVADISSTGKGPAGATTAALFLKEFVEDDIEWIHVDCFAWENNGKPGRPQGGADTGMRAIFAYLEDRYS